MPDNLLFNDSHAKLPSERNFGLLFAGVFTFAGGYVLYKSLPISLAVACFAFTCLLLALTAFYPDALRPLNRAWFALGLLLGKIVSPLVLGLIFFLVITPVAIVMRLTGRDVLKLQKQKVQTHWVDRKPVGPAPQSFKDQF